MRANSLIADNTVVVGQASALFNNNNTAGHALAGGQWLMRNAATAYGAVVLAVQYRRCGTLQLQTTHVCGMSMCALCTTARVAAASCSPAPFICCPQFARLFCSAHTTDAHYL